MPDSYAIVVEVGRAEPTCLIDIPFDPQFDPVLRSIEIAVSRISNDGVPLIPRRMDREGTGTVISERIIELTRTARIVVAVCSPQQGDWPNPNVMYELGLARALGKQFLILSNAPEKLPTDIKNVVVLKYEGNGAAAAPAIEAELRRLLGLMTNLLTTPEAEGVWATQASGRMVLQPEFWDAFKLVLTYAQRVRNEMECVYRDYIQTLQALSDQIIESQADQGSEEFQELWSKYADHHGRTTLRELRPPAEFPAALNSIRTMASGRSVVQISTNAAFVDQYLSRFRQAFSDTDRLCQDRAPGGSIQDLAGFGVQIRTFAAAVTSIRTFSDGLLNGLIGTVASAVTKPPQPQQPARAAARGRS